MESLRKNCLFLLFFFCLGGGAALCGCGGSDDPLDPGEIKKDDSKGDADDGKNEGADAIKLVGVSIDNPLAAIEEEEITIKGKGFQEGDMLIMTAADDATVHFSASVIPVSERSAKFQLPKGIYDGNYIFSLARKSRTVYLQPIKNANGDTIGGTSVRVEVKYDIPAQAGMTVVGKVHCNGTGIAGVEVSDGMEVVQTDKNGIYYLPSQKKYRNVFISLPSGYEIACDGNAPLFYAAIDTKQPEKVEQKNFALKQVDNDRHAMLALADFHLAKRTHDLDQFADYAKDVNLTAADLKNAGYKVYAMSLGDESWDGFWYSNAFGLSEAFDQIKKINVPFFHCMGNHDNDPHCMNSDWEAEQKFMQVCGPNFYSFNIGKVHYIMLDNIEYLNNPIEGGNMSDPLMGDRKYNSTIVAEIMTWLQKDLSLIADKSLPIVIGMHAPLYKILRQLDGSESPMSQPNLKGAENFISALDGFTNVTVLTGHIHENCNTIVSHTMMEHNTGAVCATWWWTGSMVGNHICKDGTPGGYGVYKFDNTSLQWHYQSKGFDKNYQFRSYDMNQVYIRPNDYTSNEDLWQYLHEYKEKNSSNEVLINVWNYDPKWTVEVMENGKKLPVTRVIARDPLHVLSYNAQRIKKGSKPTGDFATTVAAHFFKVTATSATSTLEIRVTDRFGQQYSESMKRPKAFTTDMK